MEIVCKIKQNYPRKFVLYAMWKDKKQLLLMLINK